MWGAMTSYLAYKIPEDKRAALLDFIAPVYTRTVADHVTIQLKRSEGELPNADNIEVIGVADDGNGLQALISMTNLKKGNQGLTNQYTATVWLRSLSGKAKSDILRGQLAWAR